MPSLETSQASNFVPDIILVGGTPTVEGLPQSELGYSFYNGLGCTVTIVTRTGVQLHIPPVQGRARGFVIRSTYRVGHGVIVNTHDLLNDQGLKTSKEATAIEQALYREEVRIGRGRREVATVDYVLNKQDFDRNGGSVYLTNLDLTLSTLNQNYVPKHPYSLVGQRLRLIDGNMALKAGVGLAYEVRIVDRNNRFGDRFINLAGTVYRIVASPDAELQDGVYLTSNIPANGTNDVDMPRSLYYSFEDAVKELRLYNTYNEAKTLGDPDAERDRELKDWAHRLKSEEHFQRQEKLRREAEADTSKRELEREREAVRILQQGYEERARLHEAAMRERGHNLDRQEHEFKIKEMELRKDNLHLKEALERKSQNRKDLAETVKYLPLVITGLGALWAVIQKFK